MTKSKMLLLILALSISASAQDSNCLDFDGINDYLFIGDYNDLDTLDFTIEAWVNYESVEGIGQFVICKGITTVGSPSNAGYGLRLNDQNNNDIEFLIGDKSGDVKVISSNGLTLNTWHHIAGVRSGIYISLYVDGNLVSQDSTSTIYNVNTNIPLSIGAHEKGDLSTTAEYMNGKIDEIRIWNTSRTINEINEYKDCAITESKDNLLAVYNLNEGSGIFVSDASGFNNNAVFFNSPNWIKSEVAPICRTSSLNETKTLAPIEIYPNPFSSYVEIKNAAPKGKFTFYSINGQIIASGNYQNSRINLPNIPNGMYLLSIDDEKKKITKKILKMNGN